MMEHMVGGSVCQKVDAGFTVTRRHFKSPRPSRLGRLGHQRKRLRTINNRVVARALREQGLTLQEIGDVFGVTRERARQLVRGTR